MVQLYRRRTQDAPATALIPLEQLVQDVYASSPPEAKKQILVRLVDKVYETAPAPLQSLGADDQRAVRPADVVVLVEHASHAGGAALGGLARRLAHVLTHTPSLAGSGAAAVLLALLRKRTYQRRAEDRELVD